MAAAVRHWLSAKHLPLNGSMASDVELSAVADATEELRGYRMRLAAVLCMVVSILFSFSWAVVHHWTVSLADPFEHARLRASVHVNNDNDVPGAVRSFMWSQMSLPLQPCGITAAHMQHYRRFLLLRLDDRIVEMYNPEYDPVDTPGVVNVQEFDAMCHWNESSVVRQRNQTVAVWTQETAHGHKQRMVATGTVALCLQHAMDILSGIWPCSPDSPHLFDVMRVPSVPSQWLYTPRP